MRKLFLLIATFFMATTLVSCHDDEPEVIIDGDEGEEVLPPPLPTYDVIETIVDAKAVIYAEGLDEMSPLFKNRIPAENIQTEITPETDLAVFDEAGAAMFIKNSELYEKLEDLYLRGGAIYFHKPALQASALIARLELEIFNDVPEETIPPICDVYITNIQGAEYRVDDIYSSEANEYVTTDENGNVVTEMTKTDTPSEYLYGRYAENAAKFVNEALNIGKRSRATVVSRAGNSFSEPPLIPLYWDKPLRFSQTYWKGKGNHMAKTVSLIADGIAHMTAKVRCAYSFEHDKDYYQITLSENYPGNFLWKGENKIKYKALYYDKYGGFALKFLYVTADLQNCRTDAVKVVALEGVAPNNHPANGSKENVSGWTFGGAFGTSAPLGVAGNFNFAYTSTTSITLPFSEIPSQFIRNNNEGSKLRWNYIVNNPLKYSKHAGRNGTVNNYPKISTQNVTFEQTWSWIIGNASQQRNQDLNMNVGVDFYVTTGAATSGAGSNHDYNYTLVSYSKNLLPLPTPDRFMDKVATVASPVNATSSYARKLIAENSPKFRFLIDNPERSGVVRENLCYRLRDEWSDVYNEIKNLGKFSGIDEEVTFYLQMSDGERLPVGNTDYKGIRIDRDGNVSLVK